MKQITGGDSINVPRKFRDDALLERRIKFVFSSNHPLIIDGEDDALLKRIIYLPFNYAIPDDQQDPYLGEKNFGKSEMLLLQRHCAMRGSLCNSTTSFQRFHRWTT